MRNADGRLVFSATDLSRHLACPHLTTLRRAEAFGEINPPLRYDDPRAEALKQRGIEHEQRLLERLVADGRSVATITAPGTPFSQQDWTTAAARTLDALRRGVDVVYQGRLEGGDGGWGGYPDFLIRVETPSALGAWSYEVVDAKLARVARGTALLQLLLYSDLLATVQGARARVGAPGARRRRRPHRCPASGSSSTPRTTAPSAAISSRPPRRRRRRIRNRSTTPALRVGRPLHGPATRRRPPLAGGRHHTRSAAAPDRARHPDHGRARRAAASRRPGDRRREPRHPWPGSGSRRACRTQRDAAAGASAS